MLDHHDDETIMWYTCRQAIAQHHDGHWTAETGECKKYAIPSQYSTSQAIGKSRI